MGIGKATTPAHVICIAVADPQRVQPGIRTGCYRLFTSYIQVYSLVNDTNSHTWSINAVLARSILASRDRPHSPTPTHLHLPHSSWFSFNLGPLKISHTMIGRRPSRTRNIMISICRSDNLTLTIFPFARLGSGSSRPRVGDTRIGFLKRYVLAMNWVDRDG